MQDRERNIRIKLRDDFEHYAPRCLKIRPKEVGNLVNFALNRAQIYTHQNVEEQRKRTGKVRAIILKGRQQGMSTYVGGRFYWRITHLRGAQAFILTHEADATSNLFKMTQRYHDNCNQLVKPNATNLSANEMIFGGLESGYKVGTAGNKGVGRSSTNQFFHGSEVSLWPNAAEHAKGVLQTVPDCAGTEVFLESTARGMGNYFHEQWQLARRGESEFMPIFVPWFWQVEYSKQYDGAHVDLSDEEESLIEIYGLTMGQILWRRAKIIDLSASGGDGEKSFRQEYPCTEVEAFQTTGEDTFIKPDLVMKARKGICERYGAKLLGVDPARFGDDRTSIIRRCGRVAHTLESHVKKDTMQVSGIVHKIIKEEEPDRVFIDVGGLGAGVVDRLREMGYADIVTPVNSGESPLDDQKYFNKRAEMWGVTKEWLLDSPCQIPDSDTLHADLCAPKYDFDSKNRLRIERKEKMKKRGLRSCDEADALCLTFASPTSTARKDKAQRSSGSFMAW